MDLGTIGKRVKRLGKDTVAEVQRMNEIRQINSRINNQKKQIASIYTQIGEKLYNLYKEAPLEGFDMEFQRVAERFATIDVYNDQIREIKGVRICPNCHTEVALTERFCSACGQKLPELLHIQEDEDGNMIIEGTDAEVIDVPENEEILGNAAEADAERSEETDSVTDEKNTEEEVVEVSEAESEETVVETNEEEITEDTSEADEVVSDVIIEEVTEVSESDDKEKREILR